MTRAGVAAMVSRMLSRVMQAPMLSGGSRFSCVTKPKVPPRLNIGPCSSIPSGAASTCRAPVRRRSMLSFQGRGVSTSMTKAFQDTARKVSTSAGPVTMRAWAEGSATITMRTRRGSAGPGGRDAQCRGRAVSRGDRGPGHGRRAMARPAAAQRDAEGAVVGAVTGRAGAARISDHVSDARSSAHRKSSRSVAASAARSRP